MKFYQILTILVLVMAFGCAKKETKPETKPEKPVVEKTKDATPVKKEVTKDATPTVKKEAPITKAATPIKTSK